MPGAQAMFTKRKVTVLPAKAPVVGPVKPPQIPAIAGPAGAAIAKQAVNTFRGRSNVPFRGRSGVPAASAKSAQAAQIASCGSRGGCPKIENMKKKELKVKDDAKQAACIAQTGQGCCHGIGCLFRKIKKSFQKMGSGIKKGFQKMGSGIKKGFQKMGQGIVKAGKATGKFFKKAAGTIAHVGAEIGHYVSLPNELFVCAPNRDNGILS